MQLRSLTRPSAVCHRARSVAIPLAMRRSMYTIAIVMYTVAIASTRLPHARQRARNDGLAAIGTRGHSRRPPSARGTAQRSGRAAASCWMPNPRPIAISDSRSWAAACAGRRGRSDCLFSSWSTTISPAGTVQAVTGHLAGNGGDGRERSAAFSMGAILVVFASFARFTVDPVAVRFPVPLLTSPRTADLDCRVDPGPTPSPAMPDGRGRSGGPGTRRWPCRTGMEQRRG